MSVLARNVASAAEGLPLVKVLELLPPPQHGEASAMAPLSPGWAAEAERLKLCAMRR